MGTALSFHNRHLHGTNWLVATSLIVLVFSFLNIQQISCAVITDLSFMASNSHSVRHTAGSDSRQRSKRTSAMNNPLQLSNLYGYKNSNNYGIFKVRSLCSEGGDGYMNIYEHSIQANALESQNDISQQFNFEKIDGTEDQFYIHRRNRRKYICFSRRGKLRVKGRPSDDHRCSFRHIPANLTRSSHQDNQYTKIQSVANPEWYIGFKKDAKPMRGYEHGRRREKCFMFELTRATPFTFDFSNRLMSDSPAQSETDSIPSQTHPHRHHKGETHSGRKVQSQASIDVLR